MSLEPRRRTEDMTLAETERNQADAADPAASVWVSANAGTGKTHVLTLRVMRLLLAGTAPERILCLTYTKAAAAQMSKRVFDKLAKWVTAGESELRNLLDELLGRPPTEVECARARQLFARAIETPGGLKVQTIHAFCERLLQRFPLEAAVPPQFSILDEETARRLQRDAIDDVLGVATGRRGGALSEALMTAIAYAADDSFDAILNDALRKRDWLEFMSRRDLLRQADDAGEDGEDALAQAEADYRRIFGLADGATKAGVAADLNDALPNDVAQAIGAVLDGGTKTDRKAAAVLAQVLAEALPDQRIELLAALFLTADGKPRKRLMSKKLSEAHEDIAAQYQRAQDHFVERHDDLLKLKLLDATMAIARLGSAVMQRYRDAKARRAALDYDDLLVSASKLLSASASAQWVLYKLDGGLDHILVDEAQDTSPVQWKVIEALASEFFAGSGVRGDIRTLFAVGDEKQSIYGFQGAAPEMFARMGGNFERLAVAAGLTWRRIPLTLSFRSVAAVLDGVDKVFADRARVPGLSASDAAIQHNAFRRGQAGLIEIWPTETFGDDQPGEVWAPLSDGAATPPVTRLAERIADTIRGWLNGGEVLQSKHRPVQAGDIIILLRKRRPFADQMVKALKTRGIAVAGADRMMLIDQIVVQDLMALGDFLSLPEDDLSLATVLKSPLFGLTDEHLLALLQRPADERPQRHGRDGPGKLKGGPLWSTLLAQAKSNPIFAEAAERLKQWRRWADYVPPYEFYASLLERDCGRRRLLARLGPEAADPIDEFLNLALTYDDGAPPSLLGFLDWLRSSEREIKRDMEHGRDEVRVMTVHGAKGLEAPIVFLPDTCTTQSGGRPGSLLDMGSLARPAGETSPSPMVWPVKGTSKLQPIRLAKDELAASEAEERHRLLYVAMTRARDRLYVAGFEGRRGRAPNCWYDLICQGLDGVLEEHRLADGSGVLRFDCAQSESHESRDDSVAEALEGVAPPAWAFQQAPREPALVMPLAPSRLAPLESDDTVEFDVRGEPGDRGEFDGGGAPRDRGSSDHVDAAAGSGLQGQQGPQEEERQHQPPVLSPRLAASNNRFLRGTLSHALLEHLPQMDPATWDDAASAFVDRRGKALSRRKRRSIVDEVLAILRSADFAPLFGPDSQAEVPIVAEIQPPPGTGSSSSEASRRGPSLKVIGQIDRLALVGEDVLIVDYKTNRPPPHEPDKVADAYLLQLAAYRLAVREVFPGRKVRAALLWTDSLRIMEIPAQTLDLFEQRLWHQDRKTG